MHDARIRSILWRGMCSLAVLLALAKLPELRAVLEDPRSLRAVTVLALAPGLTVALPFPVPRLLDPVGIPLFGLLAAAYFAEARGKIGAKADLIALCIGLTTGVLAGIPLWYRWYGLAGAVGMLATSVGLIMTTTRAYAWWDGPGSSMGRHRSAMLVATWFGAVAAAAMLSLDLGPLIGAALAPTVFVLASVVGLLVMGVVLVLLAIPSWCRRWWRWVTAAELVPPRDSPT